MSVEIHVGVLRDIAELSIKLIDRLTPLGIFFGRNERIDLREEQLKLLKDLTEAGIDPKLFDLLLSAELDRNLKKQFGVAFFVATIFFTLLSFGVVVGNGVYKWGISDMAITGLIIETPLQFIGLLYIIARNLFPQANVRREAVISDQPARRKPRSPPKADA
jgi:hypothetical protein